jgi:hypothetical protein
MLAAVITEAALSWAVVPTMVCSGEVGIKNKMLSGQVGIIKVVLSSCCIQAVREDVEGVQNGTLYTCCRSLMNVCKRKTDLV